MKPRATIGTIAAATGVLVVLCAGAGAAVWAVSRQFDLFGCGEHRPSGVTAADLPGVYVADDGGRMELRDGGTFQASGAGEDVPDGSGSWTLRGDSRFGDVELQMATYGTSIYLGGSREKPLLYSYVGDRNKCDLYVLNYVGSK